MSMQPANPNSSQNARIQERNTSGQSVSNEQSPSMSSPQNIQRPLQQNLRPGVLPMGQHNIRQGEIQTGQQSLRPRTFPIGQQIGIPPQKIRPDIRPSNQIDQQRPVHGGLANPSVSGNANIIPNIRPQVRPGAQPLFRPANQTNEAQISSLNQFSANTSLLSTPPNRLFQQSPMGPSQPIISQHTNNPTRPPIQPSQETFQSSRLQAQLIPSVHSAQAPLQPNQHQFQAMQTPTFQQQSQYMQNMQPPQFGPASLAYHNTQFSAPPQFIQPAIPPQFPNVNQFQNSVPHGYSQSHSGDPTAAYENLSSQFQNMSFQPTRHVPFNLLTAPPNAIELAQTNLPCLIPYTSAVTQHPMSNCDPEFKRCTLRHIPASQALLSKSKLPFGLLLTPYRVADEKTEIPVINPEIIVRCRRCRTYINPWVQFLDSGSRWKCNLCYLSNDVPAFFDWDPETKTAVDRMKRAELTHAVVEFVAPQEYMVRPPQPVAFLFLIDVSFNSIATGMVSSMCEALLSSLDKIPNTDGRTKLGFIAVDSNLHFFNLSSTSSEPGIMVVSDLDEVYLPLPYDLLAPLTECRPVIETLLQKIPTIFNGTRNVNNALGKGLQFAYKLLSPIGGKVIVLQSTLPTDSDGGLKSREDPKIYGTSKESVALQPATPFYKNIAVDYSRAQIGIDLFIFGGQYIDVATLSGCCKFTGGTTYFYPSFNASKAEDVQKFSQEFTELLTRPVGLEAVLRVRASKGIRMDAFHGNFFLRSTDLLALPNVSPHHAYAVEMSIEEQLVGSIACFQTALLHTSDCGERRIRVLTMAVPVTNQLEDVFSGADPFAIVSFLAKKAIERVLIAKLEDAREALIFKLVDILTAYKANMTTSSQSVQLLISENLKHLPALFLGMVKHESFRQLTTVPLDVRAHKLASMYTYPTELVLNMLYPRLYALHNLDTNLPDPIPIHLSSEVLDRNGLFLMDAGQDIYIYIGKAIHPDLCKDLFGSGYDELVSGKLVGLESSNAYTTYIKEFVQRSRKKFGVYPTLWCVRESDVASKSAFLSCCIEDKMGEVWSYPLFLGFLRDQVAK